MIALNTIAMMQTDRELLNFHLGEHTPLLVMAASAAIHDNGPLSQ
jgi:hypothetical protein